MENNGKIWKKFGRLHWKAVIAMALSASLAAFGAVMVFQWFAADAQASGLVPETLSAWSVGSCVTFALNLLFWELLCIGIPALIGAVAAYFFWWCELPAEERTEYRRKKLFEGRKGSSGGFSLFIQILFALKIYLDGNWNTPFSDWTFDYAVSSCLWALAVALAIIGIPLAIGGLWWLSRAVKTA